MRYGLHGNKLGICYRTEVGAKARGPKHEGVLIITDGIGFYWKLNRTMIYDDETVVAAREGDK